MFVVMAALMLTGLFGLLALGTDIGWLYHQRRLARTAADAAAIYGAQPITRHEAFDAVGFAEAALPLLDGYVASDLAGHAEAAERVHQQRHAARCDEAFLERLLADFEEKFAFRGAGSFEKTHVKSGSNSLPHWVKTRIDAVMVTDVRES